MKNLSKQLNKIKKELIEFENSAIKEIKKIISKMKNNIKNNSSVEILNITYYNIPTFSLPYTIIFEFQEENKEKTIDISLENINNFEELEKEEKEIFMNIKNSRQYFEKILNFSNILKEYKELTGQDIFIDTSIITFEEKIKSCDKNNKFEYLKVFLEYTFTDIELSRFNYNLKNIFHIDLKNNIIFDSLIKNNPEFANKLLKYINEKNLKPEDCKISINLSKNIKEYPTSFQKFKEYVDLLRNKLKLSPEKAGEILTYFRNNKYDINKLLNKYKYISKDEKIITEFFNKLDKNFNNNINNIILNFIDKKNNNQILFKLKF